MKYSSRINPLDPVGLMLAAGIGHPIHVGWMLSRFVDKDNVRYEACNSILCPCWKKP